MLSVKVARVLVCVKCTRLLFNMFVLDVSVSVFHLFVSVSLTSSPVWMFFSPQFNSHLCLPPSLGISLFLFFVFLLTDDLCLLTHSIDLWSSDRFFPSSLLSLFAPFQTSTFPSFIQETYYLYVRNVQPGQKPQCFTTSAVFHSVWWSSFLRTLRFHPLWQLLACSYCPASAQTLYRFTQSELLMQHKSIFYTHWVYSFICLLLPAFTQLTVWCINNSE